MNKQIAEDFNAYARSGAGHDGKTPQLAILDTLPPNTRAHANRMDDAVAETQVPRWASKNLTMTE
jgi:hypothetical protein